MNVIERVLPGHPDKVADMIADALVDRAIQIDPDAKCAFEVMVCRNNVFVGGESSVEMNHFLVLQCIQDALRSFNYDPHCYTGNAITQQSKYIKNNRGSGAGDQAIVVGMASNETDIYMPKLLTDSQHILGFINNTMRHLYPGMGADGKFLLDPNGVSTFSIAGDYDQQEAHKTLQLEVRKSLGTDTKVVLNPPNFSKWQGGPKYDTGITGRKITSDSYGINAPHGGGAFSGKDLTKVDRAGAYLARELAIEIVEKYGLKNAEVTLVYEMGGQKPVNFEVSYPKKNAMVRDEISKDLNTFFEREGFSQTVDRYMKDCHSGNWNFVSLANPANGHFYSNATWNKYKGLLG